MRHHIYTLEDPNAVAAQSQGIEAILAKLSPLHGGVQSTVSFQVHMASPTHGVAVFGIIADSGMGALCVEVATVQPDGSTAALAASVPLSDENGE